MSVVHRVPLSPGSVPLVAIGQEVKPDQVLATRRPPGPPIGVPVATPLRRAASGAGRYMVALPGRTLSSGELLAADGRGREVRAPVAGLLLGYDADDGAALLAPLGHSQPVVGHVRGEVVSVSDEAIELRVPGAMLNGVGGSGGAVHGELLVAVHDPGDELRASAITVEATGRIVVGGSRASAETLTRARAMGVAGIVLGGVLDKELRDFEAIQRRRREAGGIAGDLAVLLLEGFGKVGFDPGLFAWLRAQSGRMASLFGVECRLYVYDAEAAPSRGVLPRPGDRVLAHRRPFAGRGGRLLRVLDGLQTAPSGIAARAGMVHFEDGRIAAVPLVNLEATGETPGDDAG